MTRSGKTPEIRRLLGMVREAKKLGTYPDIVWESCCWEITAVRPEPASAQSR